MRLQQLLQVPRALGVLAIVLVPVIEPGVLPAAEPTITHAQLVAANYRQGMLAFQQRCSACHAVADGALDLMGPNLYGIFKRRVGTKPGYPYSDVMRKAGFEWTPAKLAGWIGEPARMLSGSKMQLPEAVPQADRIPLLSYMMLETGAADWPKPVPPRAVAGSGKPDAPLSERYPSFWNHLMSNTARYRLLADGKETRFDVYFRKDGSIASDIPSVRGFWRADERDMFCYAIYGIPQVAPQFVECFPIAAMSIPRFREELWESVPTPGIKLVGGILPGRPDIYK